MPESFAKPARQSRSQILRSLKKAPRLSPAQARRLNKLIDKSKSEKLTAEETRELQAMLETVDRQTFWNLANAYADYWRKVQVRVEKSRRPVSRRALARR